MPRRRQTLNDKSLAFRMPWCRQTLNDETMIFFLDNNQLFDQTFSYLERNMAHNDEAGGSGGKQFWELSQEMEEQPHHYEDATEDTDSDYTTPSGIGITPLMVPSRMPPLMMAAHAQMAANRRGNGRTGTRTCSAPSRRNLLK